MIEMLCKRFLVLRSPIVLQKMGTQRHSYYTLQLLGPGVAIVLFVELLEKGSKETSLIHKRKSVANLLGRPVLKCGQVI